MEWGSEIYVAENTISTVTIFQHRKLRILTLLGLYMLKWKQPAHHKGTLDNANTLLCKALYPRSYCQLRYLMLVMSTTSLLGLNINNLPLLFLSTFPHTFNEAQYTQCKKSLTQSFPNENHCHCYKKLASRSWPVLFTLNLFFS